MLLLSKWTPWSDKKKCFSKESIFKELQTSHYLSPTNPIGSIPIRAHCPMHLGTLGGDQLNFGIVTRVLVGTCSYFVFDDYLDMSG